MSTGTLTGPRPGTTSTRSDTRDTSTRRPATSSTPTARTAASGTAGRPAAATRTADPRAGGTAPFVLLIMVLLTGGLVATLWLSTAAAADSYRLDEARQVARDLSEQSERLHRDVEAAQSAPALAAAARAQGMVPAGEPAVLVIAPDGSSQIVGDPKPASPVAPPSVPVPAGPATPPAAATGAQAATDGQPAPAPAGAAAAEDQLVAVPDTQNPGTQNPGTQNPDRRNAASTPDSASSADEPVAP